MIGDIMNGNADILVAGTAVSKERSEVLYFSMMALEVQLSLLIKRPLATDITLQPYTAEFTSSIWMIMLPAILGLILLTISFLSIVYSNSLWSSREKLWISVLFVTNCFIGKGTPSLQGFHSVSFKIFSITLLLSGLLIFTYYRSAMNAFLAQRNLKLPVKSLNDIYDLNYDLKCRSNSLWS